MPINKQDLESRIDEIAGGDATFRKSLLDLIGANEEASTRLVNGFLGRADVTRKQQEAADLKKATERQKAELDELKGEYEQRLSTAEAEKNDIMKQLRDRELSVAQAKTYLDNLKRKYVLDDEDLPNMDDLITTRKTGKVVDSTEDLDTRLDDRFKKFEERLWGNITSKLLPELGSMAKLPVIWSEIGHEHQELFGKRLTKAEQNEILAKARESGKSIDTVWSEKYEVEAKRSEAHDKQVAETAINKYKEEETKRRTDALISGGEPDTPDWMQQSKSPVLQKKFQVHEEEGGGKGEGDKGAPPPSRVSAAEREMNSGAQRARERYIKFMQTGGKSEGVAIPQRGSKVA